jgi:hypothetical protein
MSTEVSRPVPCGTNARGLPLWSGTELQLYRRALGVQQTEVARRLAMHREVVGLLFENRRALVSLRGDKVEKYLAAVERAAVAQAQDVIDARSELAAFRAAK